MSVTVADLMTLPSLRRAKVIAGHKGLSKIVSSISVLESTDPNILIEALFPHGEYFGSEIVITGFVNIMDDAERQYINMRRLIEGGEVGLILFYVGVYLKHIDQRLIDLANERDFVLIVMPEGNATLRYSEVISDVTNLIYQERSSGSIVSEILEHVSNLPSHQRTIATILKMLSDCISASVVLCDSSLQILNLAAWPRNLEPAVRRELEEAEGLPPDRGASACRFLPNCRLYRLSLPLDRSSDRELFILKEGAGSQPEASLLEQAADVVRLGVNIWGQEQEDVAIHELIRAILQDEPMKMRQLANIFHINVADIHEMWILQCESCQLDRFRRDGLTQIRELLAHYCRTVVADMYEDHAVAFMDWIERTPDRAGISQLLLSQLENHGFSLTLTRCFPMSHTSDVRQAFLSYQENISAARLIWPGQSCYTHRELKFAAQCRQLMEAGEAALEEALLPLTPLQDVREDKALLHTLEVYLLDAKSSVSHCAELLFLHKNTIKYRLKRIRELLDCDFQDLPDSLVLYQAVSLERLSRVK